MAKNAKTFYDGFHPQVENAGDSERVTGERILGKHQNWWTSPRPYGTIWPCIQIGETPPKGSDEKNQHLRVFLREWIWKLSRSNKLEALCSSVFSVKRWYRCESRYWEIYLRQSRKTYVSIPADAPYTVYNITLEQALEMIEAKKSGTGNVIPTFGDIQVYEGKFGPYIKQGKDNFPLPKKYKDDPNSLDEATCNEIIMKKLAEGDTGKKSIWEEKIKYEKYIPLLVGIVLTDILTKYWVNISNPDFSVIWNILRITHVKNTGVAFGTPLPGISFIIPLYFSELEFSYGNHGIEFLNLKTGYLMVITGDFSMPRTNSVWFCDRFYQCTIFFSI